MKPKYFLFLCLSVYVLSTQYSTATVRYVSKTGTSTPPYTSWQTAADSIQKCINICSFGDTIYVANGIYKEQVVMVPGLSLIGAGMDSCVVDTRILTPAYAVKMTDSCYLSGFQILAYNPTNGIAVVIYDINIQQTNVIITNNLITDAKDGIVLTTSSLGIDSGIKIISNNIIKDITYGITCDLTKPQISENLIIPYDDGLISQIQSKPTYRNNIIVTTNSGPFANGFIDLGGIVSILNGNLFFGKGRYGLDSYGDSIINNIVYRQWSRGYIGAGSVLKNNHIEKTTLGLFYDTGGGSPPVYQYNNMWNNTTNFQNFTPDTTNVFLDPMFFNPDSMDFHLQMYSPLIDAGDPNILDIDSSRSDIGIFGGPFGASYKYQDLSPRTPINFAAVVDSPEIKLIWNKNTEADFRYYRLYRDTVAGFPISPANLAVELQDTFYIQQMPLWNKNYYYKVTSVDNQANESEPSIELFINITSIDDYPMTINDYQLYQNYPNPFNPSTKISYRLKEGGYVKLYVYDIKGELVSILVNKEQSAGYYEVEFSSSSIKDQTSSTQSLASGIYIYQLMVRSNNNIPVFTAMKKMVYLK